MTDLSYDPELGQIYQKIYKGSADSFNSMQFVKNSCLDKHHLNELPDDKVVDLIVWCINAQESRQKSIELLKQEVEELDTFQELLASDNRIMTIVLSNTEIEALNLSDKSFQILKNTGINTIQDLRDMTTIKVRAIPDMTDRIYLEVVSKLGEWGVSLREKVPEKEHKMLPP